MKVGEAATLFGAAAAWRLGSRAAGRPKTSTMAGSARVSSPDSAYSSSFWPLPETPAMPTTSPVSCDTIGEPE